MDDGEVSNGSVEDRREGSIIDICRGMTQWWTYRQASCVLKTTRANICTHVKQIMREGVGKQDQLLTLSHPHKEGARFVNRPIKLISQELFDLIRLRTRRTYKESVAYFIRSRMTGYIKIGTSCDPVRRFKTIAAHYPDTFELLAIGGSEKELHSSLNKYRVYGEWFKPADEVIKAIECLGGSLIKPIMVCGIRNGDDMS